MQQRDKTYNSMYFVFGIEVNAKRQAEIITLPSTHKHILQHKRFVYNHCQQYWHPAYPLLCSAI